MALLFYWTSIAGSSLSEIWKGKPFCIRVLCRGSVLSSYQLEILKIMQPIDLFTFAVLWMGSFGLYTLPYSTLKLYLEGTPALRVSTFPSEVHTSKPDCNSVKTLLLTLVRNMGVILCCLKVGICSLEAYTGFNMLIFYFMKKYHFLYVDIDLWGWKEGKILSELYLAKVLLNSHCCVLSSKNEILFLHSSFLLHLVELYLARDCACVYLLHCTEVGNLSRKKWSVNTSKYWIPSKLVIVTLPKHYLIWLWIFYIIYSLDRNNVAVTEGSVLKIAEHTMVKGRQKQDIGRWMKLLLISTASWNYAAVWLPAFVHCPLNLIAWRKEALGSQML